VSLERVVNILLPNPVAQRGIADSCPSRPS
jgi:hypothetical protein